LKRSRLADLARDHGITTVVETGTYLGDSTAFLVHRGFRVVTIELDSHLAERARRRFADAAAVTVLEGDSGCVLQDLVPTLTEPALFWLDGHFSGGVTARGDSDTPILRELEAIASSPLGSQHVIVIDDARCFDGRTYPTLDELRDRLSSMGRTMGGVVDDAIAIIPAK
jgi:hypothetical protein